MAIRWRAGVAGFASLAVLVVPTQTLAAGSGDGGGGGGGGGGGETTGSVYADQVLALRAENGTPRLKRYGIPATAESAATTEDCVQPVSYTAVPGATQTTNPVDGRTVWLIPLQGEWLPGQPRADDPNALPADELGACDPIPAYAMFVREAELERLNLARTSESVVADKLAAVKSKLTVAKEITLDGAGRITTDGTSLDASPEFAAMYSALMRTGTIPGLPGSMAGPPAHVGIFDAWELAAAAVGTAASKEVPITIDTVEYYNRVIGFPETDDYTSPWGVQFRRSENPGAAGSEMATGERLVDYGGVSYNRSETFVGSTTSFDASSMSWRVSRISDVVPFTQLTADPIGTRTLYGVTAFAQLADDVRAAILYYHGHETTPGFFMDPVGVDTTAAQLKAIHDPAVDLGSPPKDVFQTEPFPLTATLFNPWDGEEIAHARLRITVDAPADLTDTDVTMTSTADGQPVALTVEGGDLAGWWGADTGFGVARNEKMATPFEVDVADGAPTGDYVATLQLVDVDSNTVLAEDSRVITVKDNVPTVLWAGEIYPLVTEGTFFEVPVTVYSPVAGDAQLQVRFTGPGDDPTTDLVEELVAGDITAYASNGSDMVAMPLSLDSTGRLAGTWPTTLAAGYNPVTWYAVVRGGAVVGGYAIDVSLAGGNTVEPALVTVAAPVEHGEKPPGAGEDTTAPVVTITPVGPLGYTATFTVVANELGVTLACRLVKNDVPGLWEPCGGTKTYTGLTPGSYAFEVKATDTAGNSATYRRAWVFSPTADQQQLVPDTGVLSGPADGSWVLSHRAVFAVSSTQPGSAYAVTLNGRYRGTSGSSTLVVKGLKPGVNRITIRAVANGYADPSPVVRTVLVPRGVASTNHSRAWKMRHGNGALFSRYAQTRGHGQTFRVRSRQIKQVVLVVSQGARYGKVRVFLNGRPISGRISLRAAARSSNVLIPVRTFARPKRGVLTVKVVSHGKVVRLEGIGVSPR